MSGSKKNAEIEILAASQQAQRAFDAVIKRAEELGDRLERINKRTKRTAKESSDTFEQWPAKLGKATMAAVGLGSAMAAVQTAVQLVNQELQNQIELQERASQTELSFARKQADAAYQLPTNTDVSIRQLSDRVKDSRFRNKSGVWDIYTEAISAGQGTSTSSRLEVADLVMDYLPQLVETQPETVAQMSAAIQQMQRSEKVRTGVEGDPEAMLAYLNVVRTEGRIKDMQYVAQNIAPIPQSMATIAPGVSMQESFALAASISTLASDTTGDVTRSNSLHYVDDLKRTLLGANKYDPSMGLRDMEQAIIADPKLQTQLLGLLKLDLSEEERQELMEASRAMQKGEMGGFVKARSILLQGVQTDAPAGGLRQLVEGTMQQFPESDAAAIEMLRNRRAQLALQEEQLTFEVDEAAGRYEKDSDFNIGGVRGSVRKMMQEMGKRGPEGVVLRNFRNFGYNIMSSRMTDEQALEAALRRNELNQEMLENGPMNQWRRWTGPENTPVVMGLRRLGVLPQNGALMNEDARQRQLELLERQAEDLSRILEVLKTGEAKMQVENRVEPEGPRR